MRLAIAATGLFLFLTSSGLAQTPSAEAGPTEFEVAAIKPFVQPAPIVGGGRAMIAMGRRGGPGTNDPGQITWNGASLKALVITAYDVKPFQVSGPPWLDTERFDIVAKVPAGATKEQVLVMWQKLLAERFQLKLHRDTKEIPVYELQVGKGGPKLKEAEPDPPPDPAAKAPEAPVAGVRARMTTGPDGCPVFAGGRAGTSMMMMPGRFRLCAKKMTMDGLASALIGQVTRPIFDKTGLTAKYDFMLEFAPDGPNGMMMPMPPPAAGGAAQGGPPPEGGPAGTGPNMEPALPIFAAIQALGLKLESKRSPAEILVVDKIEKAPTEN